MSGTADLTESIFTATVALANAEERAAYIEQACKGDAALRARVEALLGAHERAGHLLDRPVPGGPERTGAYTANAQPGTVIAGRYKLLEAIGEGGMGAVWVAEQTQPVRRKVALKLIKPGMDSKSVLARFDAERQALAVMDHPNIAKVLDGGLTEAGRPFFVMEYVKGVPITEYCDTARLSVPERLKLFVQVCQAVQHAHQKGIIHRDLKPSNILVAPYDDKPVPKVIDFGLAKAMHQSLTERTLHTKHEVVLGTPLYMSPEQAQLNNLDVDTRSDIYSLGVLLYELLTGTTPLEMQRFKDAAWEEVKRLVREEEPPRPSTRLSSSEMLASLAAGRQIEPARLTKLVRGELDWIVMKALEKDRTRRYDTASSFATDVQRHLVGEPVMAAPPSAAYRLRKLAHKHRAALTTATLVAAALVLGTIVSTWQAFRADAERSEAQKQHKLAEENFQKARQAVDEYFTLVSESKLLDVPGMQPLRKELLEAALRYYQAMRSERADDPAVLADLVVAQLHVANVYHELDRNEDALAAIELAIPLAERLRHDYPNAIEQHRRLAGYWKVDRSAIANSTMPKDPVAARRTMIKFLQLWEAFARENASVEGFQSDVAAISRLLAALEADPGAGEPVASMKRAISYNKTAAAIWEQLSHAYPDVPAHRENLAKVYAELAWEFRFAGETNQVHEATAKATALEEKLIAQFPNVPAYRELAARKLTKVASDLVDTRPSEADAAFRPALQAWQKLTADFPAAHEYTLELVRAQFKYAEALAGPLKRPDDAIQVIHEGNEKLKKLAAEHHAEPRFRRALALAPRALAARLNSLGVLLGDAEKLHLQSVSAMNELAKEFPKDSSYVESTGHSYRYLGWIARDTGRPADAIAYFEKGIAAFQKLAEADIPQKDGYYREYQADTLKELALVLTAGGHLHEAENAYRRAIAVREPLKTAPPERRLAQANNYNDLATVLISAKQPHEAEMAVREGIRLKQALATEFPDSPEYRFHLAHSYLGLGYILQESGRTSDAVQATNEADRLLKVLATDASALAMLRENLGHTLWQLGDAWTRLHRSDDALQTSQKALESFQQLAASHPENPYYRQEQGASHRRLADLLDHNGRSKDAELQLRAAVVFYQKLVAESPKSASYRQEEAIVDAGLASLLVRSGECDEAEKSIRRSIDNYELLVREDPQNASYRQGNVAAVRILAELFAQQEKLTEAAAEAEKAARLAPNDFAIHEYLLDILTRIGDKGHTLDVLRGNVAAMPTSAMAHHHLAVALQRQGHNDEAIAEFQKTSELGPNWEWPHQCIANIDVALGRWENAASEFAEVIRLKPDRWEAWSGRALADSHRQQWDNAVSDYSKAINLAPQVQTNWLQRGQAYLNLAKWDKAAADFAKVVDRWPNDPEGWYYRGVASAQLNQPDAAVADLRQAIAIGFKDQDRIKNDPKLAPLRSNDDFKKLLTTFEKQKQ